MQTDSIKVVGNLKIERFTDGLLQETREIKNLIVQTGKIFIANRMLDGNQSPMSHMAVGVGVATPVSTDETLQTELQRVALVSSANADNVNTYVATFAAGVATGALTEAGIFNSASSGTMLSRTTFAVVNKGANDSITITWNITIQ